jgi:hypothetical protein
MLCGRQVGFLTRGFSCAAGLKFVDIRGCGWGEAAVVFNSLQDKCVKIAQVWLAVVV